LEKKSGKNLWSFFLVHKVIEFYSWKKVTNILLKKNVSKCFSKFIS
jgi:hypothetical protein